MPNRLQHETSPYLLQHADNPVDWYPWGDEAFERARAEDKPILLSIGYSACHWCHVMAHESFEKPVTANLMNELFVNIKVDREERPDVDDIYMQAVQALSGHGGWPMTVFLTPDGRPFYGGTYYPPEPRHGMPAFREVLAGVAEAYTNRRQQVEDSATNLTEALNREFLSIGGEQSSLSADLLTTAYQKIGQGFDESHGGFSGAPKFPQPMNLEFLLRAHLRSGDPEPLEQVAFTLRKMARGGIYDQLGGGFHRYSVDSLWLVPHFEKMLYDNAQLSRVYLHAYQLTGDAFFKTIAVEIDDYILREMTTHEGAFYSTTDADSEGEEGLFFIWSLAELQELLGDDARIAVEYWGVTGRGNFEGHNILYVPNDDEVVASRLNISVDELRVKLTAIKDKLYAVRTQRVHPGLDDKILTSWNGMMLASLAEAARVLDRADYQAAAVKNADFILTNMKAADGRLLRTHKSGVTNQRIKATLEDYSCLIDGLLELYQSTFDERWFIEARALADIVLERFAASDGGFFDTADDHEALIARPRNMQDNAVPSGNAMMSKNLIRLAAYTADERYDESARRALGLLTEAMRQYPQAFAESLNAVDMLVDGLAEVALVGAPAEPATKALLDVVRKPYRPNIITALSPVDVPAEATVPLLSYRTIRDAQPTVYVCRHFVCARPVTTPTEVESLLSPSK
ncbi:MAG: thioredoxin domain-containing protein [Chloroflexi bacterium]|nr:thioredoxin domain-containing protein [Chloroflexota bacterium]MCC6897074.1 thioredoxin domain-containing protein [Anaerolineae bacterium]